jgi:single-stranded DNA-specific DHH superfamily exonuclease
MLDEKQIKELKQHLEKAQNPIFFFDNDPDGLCSFLILRRYLGRGKGVAIKSFPELDAGYFRKIQELNADYIFILDKPIVSKNFLKEVEEHNIPLVWVDHHDIQTEIPDFVNYFNPYIHKEKSNEPVTYWCYKATEKKEDLWLAVIGCISDKFVPDFYKDFEKENKEFSISYKTAFDIFYKSQIGKIAQIFSFALKDRTTNVVNMLRFLMKVKSPYDILEENQKNFTMHSRYNYINQKYQKLLKKAEIIGKKSDKILFFQYGGDLSISADLSNELNYKFPKKVIVVVYISGVKANISIRGKKIRDLVLKSIENLENATGGGHEDAVGAQVRIEDLEVFRRNLEKLLE